MTRSLRVSGGIRDGRSGLISSCARRLDAAQKTWVDRLALSELGEIVAHRPAVRALLALVVGVGALERHRAGVVADRTDLGNIAGAKSLFGQRRELGALVLDRPRPGARSWIRVGTVQATAGWARFH